MKLALLPRGNDKLHRENRTLAT